MPSGSIGLEWQVFAIPLLLGFVPLGAGAAGGSAGGPVGTAVGVGISLASSLAGKVLGFLSRGEKDKADAEGAALTNAISSAMDLNRFAYRSGTISVSQFDDNWKRLWGALQNAANTVSGVDPEYARRMIADRAPGGKFANIWQGVFHEDALRETANQKDAYGYVLPEFQWPWPEKASYMEVSPIAGFEQNLVEQQATQPIGKKVSDVVTGNGPLIAAGAGVAALLLGLGPLVAVGVAGGAWYVSREI